MTIEQALDIVRGCELDLCRAWERYEETGSPGFLHAITVACVKRDAWIAILARKCAIPAREKNCVLT